MVEQPAAAPPEPVEPPPPAPRVDVCRSVSVVPNAIEAEPVVGSGRVLFMAPPAEGCPRFARAPVSEPQLADAAAQ